MLLNPGPAEYTVLLCRRCGNRYETYPCRPTTQLGQVPFLVGKIQVLIESLGRNEQYVNPPKSEPHLDVSLIIHSCSRKVFCELCKVSIDIQS